MPHFRVRYTPRLQTPAEPNTINWLPQRMEILCAQDEAHVRSMLGQADRNLPIFVSQTRSPVTVNRYCMCQRIA
jgi:hypothetical protein